MHMDGRVKRNSFHSAKWLITTDEWWWHCRKVRFYAYSTTRYIRRKINNTSTVSMAMAPWNVEHRNVNMWEMRIICHSIASNSVSINCEAQINIMFGWGPTNDSRVVIWPASCISHYGRPSRQPTWMNDLTYVKHWNGPSSTIGKSCT